SDGSKIGKGNNIKMEILEWCTEFDATLEIDSVVINATTTKSNVVKWENIDTSSIKGDSKNLLFTLTDPFGNTATLEITDVNIAPISLWISISGFLVISSIIYIRKRNK
ncbi:MAG: hypothetical protein ACXAAM_07610, partial [Candidatus Heimdallarchaeaceae archaeon]